MQRHTLYYPSCIKILYHVITHFTFQCNVANSRFYILPFHILYCIFYILHFTNCSRTTRRRRQCGDFQILHFVISYFTFLILPYHILHFTFYIVPYHISHFTNCSRTTLRRRQFGDCWKQKRKLGSNSATLWQCCPQPGEQDISGTNQPKNQAKH